MLCWKKPNANVQKDIQLIVVGEIKLAALDTPNPYGAYTVDVLLDDDGKRIGFGSRANWAMAQDLIFLLTTCCEVHREDGNYKRRRSEEKKNDLLLSGSIPWALQCIETILRWSHVLQEILRLELQWLLGSTGFIRFPAVAHENLSMGFRRDAI